MYKSKNHKPDNSASTSTTTARRLIKVVCIVTAIIIFCFGVPVLKLAYPTAETDYNVFLDYYYARETLNEVMITFMFLFAFLSSENSILRAFSIFGFAITFSSTMDKIFLQNFDYLYSDVIIVVASLILAIRTYRNGNPKRTKRTAYKDNNSVARGDFN